MSNWPVLEVVIGLSFVYFLFSLICSGVTEWIATRLDWRSQMLEAAIVNLFSGSEDFTDEGEHLARQFWSQPLIQSLVRPKHERLIKRGSLERKKKSKDARRRRTQSADPTTAPRTTQRPSYIPSRTFVLALLDLGARVHVDKTTTGLTGDQVDDAIAKVDLADAIKGIENEQLRRALLTLYREAGGAERRFRQAAEQWFDDSMERVSGWYRRHAQRCLIIAAAVITLAFNVDTLQIGRTLWTDDAVRAAVVTQAEQSVKQGESGTNPSTATKSLPVPMGWNLFQTGDEPQDFPNSFWDWLVKLAGLLIPVAALTMGAPLWFDLLSKVVRIRGTGAPPPATDAVRRGEGEEERKGDVSPQMGAT